MAAFFVFFRGKFMGRNRVWLALTAVVLTVFFSQAAYSGYGDVRTANRSVKGVIHQLFHKPPRHLGDNYRTWSSEHDHPVQWKNERWDPAKWSGTGWSAESAIQGFYEGDVLHGQFIDKKGQAVVEVGPQFYKLAFVDQQRIMRLLAEHTDFSQSGLDGFRVQDWHSHKLIGHFSGDSLSLASRSPTSKY